MAKRTLPWKVGCVYRIPEAYINEDDNLVLGRDAIGGLAPELAEMMFGKFVVTASPEYPAAVIYEKNRWEALQEQLMGLPNMDPQARWIQRAMLGHQQWSDESDKLKLSFPLTARLSADEAHNSGFCIVVFDGSSAEIWSHDQLMGMAGRPEPEESQLIQFFRDEGRDHVGRTLDEILAFDDFWLEHTHDYIQWLFPLPEPSKFNHHIPVLSSEDRACFRTEKVLRLQQQRALDRMLTFYGLERREQAIRPLPGLSMKSHIWLKPAGHNHLRITRIIRSLQYCYQPEVAMQVQSAVIELGQTLGQVSDRSIEYWRRATQ